MSMEKQKKRLVSGEEYFDAVCTKGVTSFFAGVFGIGGIVFLLAAGLAIRFALSAVGGGNMADATLCGGVGAVLGLVGLTGIWCASLFFKEARKVTPVALLTKSSTQSLSEVETLVRGSDRPSVAESTELLRAAQSGNQTPAEELLRATQESRL